MTTLLRITSYNVCYTKLLRFRRLAQDLGTRRGVLLVGAADPRAGVVLDEHLVPMHHELVHVRRHEADAVLARLDLLRHVITSYSIHYTKLYDDAARKDGRFLVVSDVYPTPTTDVADVVLPAALWIEQEGLFVV